MTKKVIGLPRSSPLMLLIKSKGGAAPKVTESESESNCPPNSLSALIILATAPSARSAIAAINRRIAEAWRIEKRSREESTKLFLKITNNPQVNPKAVIAFGITKIFFKKESPHQKTWDITKKSYSMKGFSPISK